MFDKNGNQHSIRDIFESCVNEHGPASGANYFNNKIRDLVEGVADVNDGQPQLRPEDFSLKEIYEAVGPSTFPVTTGTLISKKVMDAYTLASKKLDKLVTPFDSNLEVDRVPGMYTEGDLKPIRPGQPYDHSGDIKEKYVQVVGEKRGAILDITEEMVTFDQTGIALMQASQFGERAAQDREKRGMLTIQDATYQGDNYYAWYPAATRVALYSTSTTAPHRHSNQVTNALAAWDDIDAADKLLGLMEAENGDALDIEANVILVPRALKTLAKRLILNTQLVGGSNEEMNPFANAVEVIDSTWLDKVSSTAWYWGDFKKQFVEKVVYPLQVMVKNMQDNQDGFERDIFASYKVRHYTQVAATDFTNVVKSTGAS